MARGIASSYSSNSVNLNAGENIGNSLKTVNFSGIYHDPFNMKVGLCITLVDSKNNHWAIRNDIRYCQDVHILPENPAVCYLNYGEDFAVKMGTVERSKLASVIGTSPMIEKSIDILCTKNSQVDVMMSFKYNPLTFGGKDAISTNLNGVGVAILYNGKPMSTTTQEHVVLANGYSDLKLGFEVVRSPSVAVKDIETGNFSANAVMIMVQQ